MLDVEGIQTYYGESHVLHGVSLRVGPGEAVALLGRNGAGKTTLIRSIMGFTPPRDGRILLEGQPIHDWPAHRIARRGLALVPQGRRIFAPLSVRENLLLGARSATGGPSSASSSCSRASGSAQARRAARSRAASSRCWPSAARSSPTAGCCSSTSRRRGSPRSSSARSAASSSASRPSACPSSWSSRTTTSPSQIADRVYVMSKGQIVYEGTPAALEANEEVKRHYLGVA